MDTAETNTACALPNHVFSNDQNQVSVDPNSFYHFNFYISHNFEHSLGPNIYRF